MKILYFHTGRLEEAKAHNIQVLQMCKAFAELGHDVVLAISSRHLDQEAAIAAICDTLGLDELPFEVLPYPALGSSPKIHSILAARHCRKLCRSTPHDVLFIRNHILLPLVGKSCGPIIFESHNNVCLEGMGAIDRIWQKRIVSLSRTPQVILFIAISSALANWWQDHGVPQEKLLALHDAVDPSLFRADLTQTEARKKTGLPEGRPIVLYAGSLYRNRNIESILKLAEQRRDALFVVVGGPEEARRRLERSVARKGLANVLFQGPVPYRKIPAYLASADVLLMLWSRDVSTINYCSPLKVFEYMAAERIIVGHKFPTIEEVVRHGEHAYLVDSESPAELVAALNKALDEPNMRMAKQARQAVLEHHTWSRRCETIISRTNT